MNFKDYIDKVFEERKICFFLLNLINVKIINIKLLIKKCFIDLYDKLFF